jgi:hypothetical protein
MYCKSSFDIFTKEQQTSFTYLTSKYKTLPNIKLSQYKTDLQSQFNISLSNQISYYTSLFDSDTIYNESTPLILDTTFTLDQHTLPLQHTNLIRKLICPFQLFNVTHFGIEASFTVELKPNTTFWVISRASTPLTALALDSNCLCFDVYNAIIKTEFTYNNELIISLGKFVINEYNDDMLFKIYRKEKYPLSSSSHSNSNAVIKELLEQEERLRNYNESIVIHVNIIDSCNEKVIVSISYNNNTYEINGDCFIPVNDVKRTVMFGATGSYCVVHTCIIHSIEVNKSQLIKK